MAIPSLWRAFSQSRALVKAWRWPGIAGLSCLTLALVVGLIWLPSLEHESAALSAALTATERRAATLTARRLVPVTPPATPAQRFREGFPAAADRQDRLAVLLTLVAKNGLDSRRSEFRLTQDRDFGLLRYTVIMPVAGPYSQVRRFLEEAQAHDPALSLDRLRLRRASTSASVVETDLTWSFFMQPEPESATFSGLTTSLTFRQPDPRSAP